MVRMKIRNSVIWTGKTPAFDSMKIIKNVENTNTEGTIYMVKGPNEKIYYKTEFGKVHVDATGNFIRGYIKKALSKDNAMCKNKRGMKSVKPEIHL
jgi:hypothetical protein